MWTLPLGGGNINSNPRTDLGVCRNHAVFEHVPPDPKMNLTQSVAQPVPITLFDARKEGQFVAAGIVFFNYCLDVLPGVVSLKGALRTPWVSPGLVGLFVVNVQIPDDVPSGDAVNLALSVGGVTSNTVTIAVQ